MEIVYKKTVDLIPYVNNTRTHSDKQVNQIASSIKEFGFTNPILIDEQGGIIAGHGRLMAANKLKMQEVPCIVLDGLTETQKKAYIIADNKLALNAGWDEELLKIELEGLKDLDFDLSLVGFNSDELDGIFKIEPDEVVEVVEDDFGMELPKEPKSKMGDIWLLGRHRLMCGDSTTDDVDKLMNGNKADMVFTDPPYGMKKEKDGVLNDNLNYDDLLEFNKQWIPITFDSLKDNGSWYCWGIDEPLMDIYSEILKPMIKSQKATFRNLLTWNKNNGQGQLSDSLRMYATADEKCLFVMCGVQGFSNNTEDYFEGWEVIRTYLEQEAKRVGLDAKKLKKITGVGMYSHWFTKAQWTFIPEEHYKKIQNYYNGEAFKQEYDALKQEYDALKQEWYKTRAYFNNTHDNMNNVWHISRAGNEERELTGGHATPKPLALCARAIKSSSRENEIVLDVFGGSGSTLIACEQLNRKCYMMELDEKYIDVIVYRYKEFKQSTDGIKLLRDGKEYSFEDIFKEV